MPFIGLSPFLRSPLGTRINRGYNSETIHVIVRQFIFAPIFTPFFPSFDISAFFPEMVRPMTFLLYMFSDIDSSCFFPFGKFSHASYFFGVSQKAPWRMPLCYLLFTVYLILHLLHFDHSSTNIFLLSSFHQFLSLCNNLLFHKNSSR